MSYADGKSHDVAVKLCPVEQVRTYPLEYAAERAEPDAAECSRVPRRIGALEIVAVNVDLMSGGEVKDTRRIAGAELKALSASGPRVQASGATDLMAFQFCSGALIPQGAKLAGPTLNPGEALLLMQQPFAYKGARDTLQVRVQAERGGEIIEASARLPIRSEMSKTVFRFPMKGQWFSAVGADAAHRAPLGAAGGVCVRYRALWATGRVRIAALGQLSRISMPTAPTCWPQPMERSWMRRPTSPRTPQR